MSRTAPMEVRLDQLAEGEAVSFNFDEGLPAFAEVLATVAESKGVKMSGAAALQVEAWPERVDVRGQLKARGPFTCVRCLERFDMSIEREVTHILVRSLGAPEGADDELELQSADMDRSEFSGNSVDLAAVLREELLLAMPMKAVCKEECAGICAGCGVDLNSEPCICTPVVDERWAALAALKDDNS